MRVRVKKREYSPFLTIYKPQMGSLISILERVTGIFLGIIVGLLNLNYYFLQYNVLNYNFYLVVYSLEIGNNIISKGVINFVLINMIYHIVFLPVITSKINSLQGNINNYREYTYKQIMQKRVDFIIAISVIFIVVYILIM